TAAHSEPGVVLGTVGYMSPEQVRGKASDHRSDIFALGAILYEMLSGKSPFRRETTADSMSAILNEDPPDISRSNSGISLSLDSLIRHCLEKNPEERFQSARDLAFDLQMITGNLESAQLQPITADSVALYAIPAGQNSVLACCKNHAAWLYHLDSGTSEQVRGLTEDDLAAQWTPDGHSIFVTERGTKPLNVVLVNIETGQRTVWKQIAPSDPTGILSVDNFHITPDGKTYVYSVRRILSDLFLVKGLR
ncbi:MAG: hypothetical protein C5B54_06810, partial [Acidobacteria bacterium]